MKLQYFIISTFSLMMLSGCSENILVQRLKEHGITENNTAKLRFISSPGAYGDDTKVVIEDTEVIKAVWARIHSSTPTNRWSLSGFHSIEFYTANETGTPAATLMLNVSNAAYLEGDLWYHLDSHKPGYYGLWKCPGLENLVIWHLKKEYEQRHGNS